MEDYYKKHELRACEPDYKEQFFKLKNELEALGAKITIFDTPKELQIFNVMNVDYDNRAKNPYNIVIPNHLTLWRIVDLLGSYKHSIEEKARKTAKEREFKAFQKDLGL